MEKRIKPGTSPERVSEVFEKYPEDWQAQYDMLLPDGKTCADCVHSVRCKTVWGGDDNNTSCQFDGSRYTERKRPVNIGHQIKFRRKELGINQLDMSEKIGLSQTSISHIENGKHFPELPTLKKICDFLKLKIKIELTPED